MKETIAQFLKVTDFPFFIKNKDNKEIYFEYSDGYWIKHGYDLNGKLIYYEDSNGYWNKHEYDQDGNRIYFEDSNGFWYKREYDQDGNRIYFENSNGNITDERPKIIELSLQEVADKFGLDVKNIRIKD
jgi:hypothetical protein